MPPQPEREPEGRPGGPPPGPPGKKILGMSRPQAIGLGLVGVGALIYLIWRARKNAQAQQAATPAGTCPDGSTPDSSGNCPQNSQDYSGQLATLQTEIADLQGALAGAGGGGGGYYTNPGSVAAATGTPTTSPEAAPLPAPAAAPKPAAAPAPAKAPAPAAAAGPISNLQATTVGSTSFTVRWNPATGATQGYAYIVRDLATHTQVGGVHTTKGTSATVTGLKSKTDYNFGVQGLPGGAGNNIHVKTK